MRSGRFRDRGPWPCLLWGKCDMAADSRRNLLLLSSSEGSICIKRVGVWLAPAPRTAGPLVDAQQTSSSGRALRRDGTGLAGLSGGQVVKASDPHNPLWKLRGDLQGAAHGLDEAPQRADVQIRPAFELGETRRRPLPNRRQVLLGPVTS